MMGAGSQIFRPAASLAGILWTAQASPALRAEVPLPEIEEQRRRAQEDAETRRKLQEAPHVRLDGPGVPEADDGSRALPEEERAFAIRRFELEPLPSLPAHIRALGASRGYRAPFRFALAYLERYRGRRIGPRGIETIRKRLARRIMAQGYTTTRIVVPDQDVSGGTLTFHLLPGVIQAIRVTGDGSPDAWRSQLPSRPGDLLNLRDLEQGLEQMKRCPSQDVDIRILPGAGPGESEVVLAARLERPWRVDLNVDDAGRPELGTWQASMGAAWDSPTSRSDMLAANLSHDADFRNKGSGSWGAGLQYSVPLGYWTFGVGLSHQRFAQRFDGQQRHYTVAGRSSIVDFRAGLLIHRDQASRTAIQARTGHRVGRTFVEGTEIKVQRRATSFAELGCVHTRYVGRSHLDLALAHRQGVPWFGAAPDFPEGLQDGPTFFYRLQTLDVSFAFPVVLAGRNARFASALHAQRAGDVLFASEHMAIGNRWTVRGFNGEQTLAGESGAYLRNSLDIAIASRTSLQFGLDAGQVGGPGAADLSGRFLAGATVGLKGTLGRRITYNVFLGSPLHRPGGFGDSRPVLGFSAGLHL